MLKHSSPSVKKPKELYGILHNKREFIDVRHLIKKVLSGDPRLKNVFLNFNYAKTPSKIQEYGTFCTSNTIVPLNTSIVLATTL